MADEIRKYQIRFHGLESDNMRSHKSGLDNIGWNDSEAIKFYV